MGPGPGGPVRVSPQGSSEQAEKQQDGSRFHCGRKPWLPPTPHTEPGQPEGTPGADGLALLPRQLLCRWLQEPACARTPVEH